jgi:hypothetical protein
MVLSTLATKNIKNGGNMNLNETITIGWCDNGTTEGKFTEGLMSVVLSGASNDFPITSSIRVNGNQIGRQRQSLIDYWYDNLKTDWLFWIDSDIVLTLDIWKKICSTADKDTHPMVSGVYFIAKEEHGSLPVILPCIFDDIDEFSIRYYHPLPVDQILRVDCAGMGLIIMHRNVVTMLRKEYGKENSLFAENTMTGDKFIGEDISFFRKCKKINIPLYANTGAIAKHIKRVPWDLDYYKLYWNREK